jgi:hypothetical protein
MKREQRRMPSHSLPLYFRNQVEILHGWNTKSLEIPWETAEETQLCLGNADTLSQSALAAQVVQQAQKEAPTNGHGQPVGSISPRWQLALRRRVGP